MVLVGGTRVGEQTPLTREFVISASRDRDFSPQLRQREEENVSESSVKEFSGRKLSLILDAVWGGSCLASLGNSEMEQSSCLQ